MKENATGWERYVDLREKVSSGRAEDGFLGIIRVRPFAKSPFRSEKDWVLDRMPLRGRRFLVPAFRKLLLAKGLTQMDRVEERQGVQTADGRTTA